MIYGYHFVTQDLYCRLLIVYCRLSAGHWFLAIGSQVYVLDGTQAELKGKPARLLETSSG